MREHETYEVIKHPRQDKSDEGRSAEASVVSLVAVESVAKRQAEMLEAVQKYVPVSLVERLRLKSAREQQLLRESIEREQRTITAAKKTIYILNQKFFKFVRMEQQQLD